VSLATAHHLTGSALACSELHPIRWWQDCQWIYLSKMNTGACKGSILCVGSLLSLVCEEQNRGSFGNHYCNGLCGAMGAFCWNLRIQLRKKMLLKETGTYCSYYLFNMSHRRVVGNFLVQLIVSCIVRVALHSDAKICFLDYEGVAL
jgi:hypothetical protein